MTQDPYVFETDKLRAAMKAAAKTKRGKKRLKKLLLSRKLINTLLASYCSHHFNIAFRPEAEELVYLHKEGFVIPNRLHLTTKGYHALMYKGAMAEKAHRLVLNYTDRSNSQTILCGLALSGNYKVALSFLTELLLRTQYTLGQQAYAELKEITAP